MPSSDDDLVPDDTCGMDDAAPWLALGAGFVAGVLITGGWLVKAGWAIAHDPAAWHFLTGR